MSKYHVKQFARGHWHVVNESGHPIYDGARDGNDAPVIFHDYDAACDCAERMNQPCENCGGTKMFNGSICRCCQGDL